MTSQKKIGANQRNSKKSSGPKSKRGKQRSSANALTLGTYAKKCLLPDENVKDYMALSLELHKELSPVRRMEEEIVQDIVSDTWRLRRLDRAERALINRSIDVKVEAELNKMSLAQLEALASIATLPEVQETLSRVHASSGDKSRDEKAMIIKALMAVMAATNDKLEAATSDKLEPETRAEREAWIANKLNKNNENEAPPLEYLRYEALEQFRKTYDIGARLLDTIVPTDGSQAMERLD